MKTRYYIVIFLIVCVVCVIIYYSSNYSSKNEHYIDILDDYYNSNLYNIETLNSNVLNIKQNLWPFPKSIKQDINNFVFNSVTFNNSHQYTNNLQINYKKDRLNNPFDDFNTYIKSLYIEIYDIPNRNLNIHINIAENNFSLSDLNSKNHSNNEVYTLDICSSGNVKLKANTYIGIGYGLATLQQLIENYDNNHLVIKNLPIHINDSSNTFYRNIMLDTGRNYYSTKSICDLLRNMGHNKLNHLDWHISDNQSFPLNVGKITNIFSSKLSSDPEFKNMRGAFNFDQIYNIDNIKQIIYTAKNYGIVVIPGIDSPGHCSSLMYGSKEATAEIFGSGNGFQIINYYQSNYQGSMNAPEPIIGYLDIGKGTSQTHIQKIAHTMHYIFDEVISAFEISTGTVGNIINFNADEVSTKIISISNYSYYLNELFSLFNDKSFDVYKNINNNKLKLKNDQDTFNNIKILLWADPILELNIIKPDKDSGIKTHSFKNKLDLNHFSKNNQLIIGIWNLWPTVSVEQYNYLFKQYPNVEVINYNSNYFYMDSGYAGNNLTGLAYDYIDSKVTSTLQQYWISAIPQTASQWGPNGSRGWAIGYGKIYNYNFHWDYTGNLNSKWNGMSQLNNIQGAGLAIWSETIHEGILNEKLFTNMCAFSELVWKYNEHYASDNIVHMTYRLHHHLMKMRQEPYNVTNNIPLYSSANIDKAFPQGAILDESKNEDLGPNGEITQEYLDKHYKSWNIQIRNDYNKLVNNNLMIDINPSVNNPKALMNFPLCSLNLYKNMPQLDYSNPNSELRTRVNPWLCHDINKLMNSDGLNSNLARTNYSSKSKLYSETDFYIDQRDTPIKLNIIPNPN
jgi:hypothetical protein